MPATISRTIEGTRSAGTKPSASGAAKPIATTTRRLVKASSMATAQSRGGRPPLRRSPRAPPLPAALRGLRNRSGAHGTLGAMTTLSAQATSVAERRASGFRPIADYGLLADCTSSALVDRDGSIDWLCMPHYDSPAVFARILDPEAGHWSIAPVGPCTSRRRYVEGTLVVETTFTTSSGVVRLTDAMAFAEGQRGHDLGKDAPHEVVRLGEGVEGSVELDLELAPRPEYGLVRPLFRKEQGGGRTFGGPNQIAVSAGVPVEIADSTMLARFTVAEGEQVGFALHWASVVSALPMAAAPEDVVA